MAFFATHSVGRSGLRPIPSRLTVLQAMTQGPRCRQRRSRKAVWETAIDPEDDSTSSPVLVLMSHGCVLRVNG